MAIETIKMLSISYPDFKLNDVIDPDAFDVNNSQIVDKVNEITTKFNPLVSGTTGASNITMSPVTPFTATTIQGTFNALVPRLQATTSGASGSEFIGARSITGVSGTTVYAQFVSLKGLVDTAQNTANTNATNLTTHKTSSDHDTRYYTKTLLDGGQLDTRYYTKTYVDNSLNAKTDKIAFDSHKTSGDHDNRYYTKAQIDLNFRGGDTLIREEVFVIISANNGDGTFSYTDTQGNLRIGTLTAEGYQTFTLRDGKYQPNENRLEVMINDTLRRSVKSGGIIEIDDKNFNLTTPEGAGSELTVRYFERLGLMGEHAMTHEIGGGDELRGLIHYNKIQPVSTKAMWFKLLN